MPICCRKAAESAAVADGGSINASGSTGSNRNTTNTTSDSSSKVGIATRRRRSTIVEASWNTAARLPCPAACQRYLYSTGNTYPLSNNTGCSVDEYATVATPCSNGMAHDFSDDSALSAL